MHVCMYYVDMNFAEMRHSNIAPLQQPGFCHNNVTVENTIKYVCTYVCMYVYICTVRMFVIFTMIPAIGSIQQKRFSFHLIHLLQRLFPDRWRGYQNQLHIVKKLLQNV